MLTEKMFFKSEELMKEVFTSHDAIMCCTVLDPQTTEMAVTQNAVGNRGNMTREGFDDWSYTLASKKRKGATLKYT